MRFSRVRLVNWRNFKEVDVQLENRAFLIGANASGKSNFLDVFRFLRDIAAPRGGGFQQAVLSRGGVSKIRNVNARSPQIDVVVDVELSEDDEVLWRYRIEFTQDNNRKPILKHESIWRHNQELINRPDKNDREDEKRLEQTVLEQTFANADFREVADFFRSVRYSHIVPQLVRDAERYIGQQNDPFGGDFLEVISSVPKRSRDARLRRIQGALQKAIPQLSELEWLRDESGIAHLRGRYESWRKNGAWQDEREFSDGTIRLIGFLWSLQDGTGPLLLEEPELSLHPGVVQYLPQMILNVQRRQKVKFRQTMISTHSPEMLRDEGIGADETLLFYVGDEGTTIQVGADDEEIMRQLAAGFTVAEAALPRTEPANLHQLPLWK